MWFGAQEELWFGHLTVTGFFSSAATSSHVRNIALVTLMDVTVAMLDEAGESVSLSKLDLVISSR